MAAYDNVSLPSPPNIATAGNYAQMLMQGLRGIGEDYQKGEEFKYQQQQRNLFQDPNNRAILQDAIKNGNYGPLLQLLTQAGGASTASALAPQLMGIKSDEDLANAIRGGGQPQSQNTNPTAPAAGSPAQIDPKLAQAQPRIPYSNPSTLSATGMDSAGAETVRSLTAGIANGRPVQDTTIGNYARALGVDPDTPLSADQEARARKIIGNNLGTSGGVVTSNQGGTNPVPQAGVGEDEGNTNQGTPVGATGGPAISPAPSTGGGGIGQPAPFNSRFNAAYGTGAPVGGAPVQTAQAAAPGASTGPQQRPTPVGTEAEARRLMDQGNEIIARGAKAARFSPAAKELAQDAARPLFDRAKQIFESLGKYNEPTTNERDIASGAAGRMKQIEADTKYYDSLHRGLVGSGMIAAQQKQNVDILRQVAASPNFIPGAGSDIALAYQRLAAQFGINPKGAAPREIFNQVAARILADQFSGMKSMAAETGETGGRLFKSMLDIEEKANITSNDTSEGIKAKLDIIDKTGDLMMRWADLADDYKKEHGQLDAGFDKKLRADIAKGRVPNAVPKGGPPLKAGRYRWTPDGGVQSVQ